MGTLLFILFNHIFYLGLGGFPSYENEKKPILELLIEIENIEYLSEEKLDWKNYGFTNYQKLNHENIVNFERGDFELDLWFEEGQKQELTQKVQTSRPTKIQKNNLPQNVALVTKDYDQLRRTVFSFSQPIIQEGKDGVIYAFLLVSQTFETEGWSKYYFLEKVNEKWKVKAVRVLGFS